MAGTYGLTAAEKYLLMMVQEGWATGQDGDVEAPTGYFWRITNLPVEMAEIRQAFDDDFVETYNEAPPADEELLGSYIIRENSQGLVDVISYPSEAAMIHAFDRAVEELIEWGPSCV